MSAPQYTTREIAKIFAVSQQTVRQWVAEGCPAIRVGAKSLRYDLQTVRAWHEARESEYAAKAKGGAV